MGRALRSIVGGVAASLIICGLARASGDGPTLPWYLDQYGGEPADMAAFYDGQVGILMARAPRPRLLAAWRLLHRLNVGPTAGAALSIPCCDRPGQLLDTIDAQRSIEAWLEARESVPGAAGLTDKEVGTDRPGEDYTSFPNCGGDAFDNAAATLRDRAARFGAASAAVTAWLATQDMVFQACTQDGVALPPPLPNAPSWLKADRAYQEAAFDLYDGRAARAAERFAAISRDPDSPWRPMGLYLQARALKREALVHPSPQTAEAARAAVAVLAAAPQGTFGQSRVEGLSSILAFHFDAERRMNELDAKLRAPEPPSNIAALFRDYEDLADAARNRAEIADWIATLAARPTTPGNLTDSDAQTEQRYEAARGGALSHAISKWRETHDRVWLIASLSLMDRGAPEAPALVAAAEETPADYPGWLTVQYHLVRLTLASADPQLTRKRLDAILSRHDLSGSDRNIFTAERLQVAESPQAFVRLALRRRICAWRNYLDTGATGCARDRWLTSVEDQSIYDGDHGVGAVGLGEDARAIIDRLPLAMRIEMSRDPALPAKIRLDIALTCYARALQLGDYQAIDRLSYELAPLLPQLSAEWRRIPITPPGRDKQFAAYMVMANIPGMCTDLVNYQRPEGPVVQFQTHWMDWIILPRGRGEAGISPPPLGRYQTAGYLLDGFRPQPDARTDLNCLGECGRGGAPIRLPDFAAQAQKSANAERAYFIQGPDTEFDVDPTTGKPLAPPPTPAGGSDIWEEMLAFANTHPADPRIPEALHWIVHASHFGASHNQSGRRAFELLHHRYPNSVWAKRTTAYSE